jgi:hypothetical protein
MRKRSHRLRAFVLLVQRLDTNGWATGELDIADEKHCTTQRERYSKALAEKPWE